MAEKYLIVIDMQKDFIYGALGSSDAQAIVPKVVERVKNFDGAVIFTRDTHGEDYPDTQEGKLLPVKHCLAGSDGWELIEPLEKIRKEASWPAYQKGTFGCVELAADLCAEYGRQSVESIELVGVCTDICVVSNALLLKAYLPEVPVIVHADCCAGVTPEAHNAAILTMKSCQVIVEGE